MDQRIQITTNSFYEEIKRIEKEKEYYAKLNLIDKSQLGTQLMEFYTISDYISKQIFIENNSIKIDEYKIEIKKLINEVISYFGYIPDTEVIMGDFLGSLVSSNYKLLITYFNYLDQMIKSYQAEKDHLIDGHEFEWDREIDFFESMNIQNDCLHKTIITYNDLDADFAEFENEIKVAIKTDPELTKVLDYLEEKIYIRDSNENSQN